MPYISIFENIGTLMEGLIAWLKDAIGSLTYSIRGLMLGRMFGSSEDTVNMYSGITVMVVLAVTFLIVAIRTVRRIRPKNLGQAIRYSSELTAEEFLEMRNEKGRGNKLTSAEYNIPGIYILGNRTKHMYYVGQATKLLTRVNSHLTGKGNGDVYADYVHGDRFTVRLIGVRSGKQSKLNRVEMKYIRKYHAAEKGYNRTVGNR